MLNPRRSSACDCTCVLTRIDLVNDSIMMFALELIWHAFRYQFIRSIQNRNDKLQVQQLYTAGIPLLEAYLLPIANNRTRKERLSQEQIAASHVVQILKRHYERHTNSCQCICPLMHMTSIIMLYVLRISSRATILELRWLTVTHAALQKHTTVTKVGLARCTLHHHL